MKNLVINKGCFVLVDETGNEEFLMGIGSMVGYLEQVALSLKHRGHTDEYLRQEQLVQKLMDTYQFREWLG